MGTGASAAGGEGRIFCHHCGARSAHSTSALLRCGHCGATEGVEATDARLPVTAAAVATRPPQGQGSSPAIGAASALLAGAGGATPSSAAPAPAPSSLRVESVTVVAAQRPEDGGLLLRVLPNVVARVRPPDGSSGRTAEMDGSGAGDGEAEVPPEPACEAFVSRLEPKAPGSFGGAGAGAARPAGEEAGGLLLCVICSEDMDELGGQVVGLACGHHFHEGCIRKWFTRRHTCPTCRLEFEVDDVKYLRSIGLTEEADALEAVHQEKQAIELEAQAVARRRWVEAMRRGEAVHFGLTCRRCLATPLIGDGCFRCTTCDEDYILCGECLLLRESLLSAGGGAAEGGASSEGGSGGLEEHPADHAFLPFRTQQGIGASGVPPGPGGLLTVLVPAPAEPAHTPGDAALAAAEVAFAAVRSLALAPLVGSARGGSTAGGGNAAGGRLSRSPRRAARHR